MGTAHHFLLRVAEWETGDKRFFEKPESLGVMVSNNEHISTMINRIVRDFDPVQIILFGSHARGEANRHSDIDLLVVFSECADKRKTAVDIRRVLKDMPVPKDIIVSTPEELERKRDWVGSVLRYAQQEGITLYDSG